MEYINFEIGERIKKEREMLDMTQEEFGGLLPMKSGDNSLRPVHRGVVYAWENGSRLPSLAQLKAMCKVFDCEMGYLLCEEGYENKTRKTTDICKATGLSEEAANVLRQISGNTYAVVTDNTGAKQETISIKNQGKNDFYSFLIEHHQQLCKPVMKILEYNEIVRRAEERTDYSVIANAYQAASALHEAQQKEAFESEMRQYYKMKADSLACDEKEKQCFIGGCMLADSGLFEALQFSDSSSRSRKGLEFYAYDIYLDLVKDFIKIEGMRGRQQHGK